MRQGAGDYGTDISPGSPLASPSAPPLASPSAPPSASPYPGIDKKGLVRDLTAQLLAVSPDRGGGFTPGAQSGGEREKAGGDDGPEIVSQLAVGQDLNLVLLHLGNTLEYTADNCFGMMAAGAWAQFGYAAFPIVTQWLAPLWWVAIVSVIAGSTATLVTAHWIVNDCMSRRVGSTGTQRTFYCILWMIRPLVGGLCGGACAAIELALGLSSGKSVLSLLFLAISVHGIAVACTMLQYWIGCGETTQCFAARAMQLILMTAAARSAYGLWVACARGVTGTGPLTVGPPSFQGGLGTYGWTHLVYSATCALFFVYMLRRRPQDNQFDLAVTDVGQYTILYGWSTDHCYVTWELCRAFVKAPAPEGLDSYGAMYGFLPYEYPTPVYALVYGVLLLAIAALMAWLRPNKSFLPVEDSLWWVAVWFMWAVQAVFYMVWAGFQNGRPVWQQGVMAASLCTLQVASYVPADWLKSRALPEVEEAALDGLPGLSAQQKEDILRFRYADSFVGTPGHGDGPGGTFAGSFLWGPRSYLSRGPRSFRSRGTRSFLASRHSYSATPYTGAETNAPPNGSFLIRRRGSALPPVLVQPTGPGDDAAAAGGAPIVGLDPVPLVANAAAQKWQPPGDQPQSLLENLVCFTPCPPVVSLIPSMLAKAATHPDVLVPVAPAPAPGVLGTGPVAWTGTGFAPASAPTGSLDAHLAHLMQQANADPHNHQIIENEIDT
eukprot:TRINITY_DN3667_c0_g2_i1.p1 TRINITY_DN3667_c0_g2~~TRINITY_DN3667_c0_g2_i1.p1  ORF type:complete len:745 (+),score=141.98 TRINITY_DN3667_c0_g2_i1:79-2235(+)